MKAPIRISPWGPCAALLAVTAWADTVGAAPASGEDIRDIRPLILIPPWWHSMVIAIAVTLALAAAFVAYRWWRRRWAKPLTPEQQALAALRRAESLAREGRSREWAEVVAQTLRASLSARLGQDACPQTTSELARAPWLTAPYDAVVDAPRLLDLLSVCDLTRFAMARLDADSLVASTETARAWITRLFAPPSAPTAPRLQVTP